MYIVAKSRLLWLSDLSGLSLQLGLPLVLDFGNLIALPGITQNGSVVKQALQWTPQNRGSRVRPRNTWKRDLEKEMWTAGFMQIQLEEDAVGGTGQSWMEKSGLWPMLHWE